MEKYTARARPHTAVFEVVKTLSDVLISTFSTLPTK
jgi:hypothetical protein